LTKGLSMSLVSMLHSNGGIPSFYCNLYPVA